MSIPTHGVWVYSCTPPGRGRSAIRQGWARRVADEARRGGRQAKTGVSVGVSVDGEGIRVGAGPHTLLVDRAESRTEERQHGSGAVRGFVQHPTGLGGCSEMRSLARSCVRAAWSGSLTTSD